jgi:integrase/recombinase XerD
MHRAFWFDTDAGAYWSVINDGDYSVVELADQFLQYMRFATGRAESTTRKYAEAIAVYHRFCTERSLDWSQPAITAFHMWLRIAPSPRHPHPVKRVWCGPGHPPARDNGRLNLIYAVCEMFKFAAAQSIWDSSNLGQLFELAQVRNRGRRDGRSHASTAGILRRRHRIRPRVPCSAC